MAGNAGGTVAGAYTGAIPTMAALTSTSPMGQAAENAGQARASSYMGGTTALQGALQGVGQNALLYGMMDRFAPGGGANYAGVGQMPSIYQSGGVLNSIFGR
jgi:hypothetical protein